MIKIKAFNFLFFVVFILSSCHKKLTIAEITIGEKENTSIYRDVKKTNKNQLLNTDFFIQIKNSVNFPVEILMVKNYPSFYGIGCNINLKKTQGSRIDTSKLKLFPVKFGNYGFSMDFLEYKNDVIKEALENLLEDKVTILPKEECVIKINLNKKELDEKELRRLIRYSPDESYTKKQREITLTEDKIPFDTLWDVSVSAHIIFAYRFTNEPNKVLLEHRSKIYCIEKGSNELLKALENLDE